MDQEKEQLRNMVRAADAALSQREAELWDADREIKRLNKVVKIYTFILAVLIGYFVGFYL